MKMSFLRDVRNRAPLQSSECYRTHPSIRRTSVSFLGVRNRWKRPIGYTNRHASLASNHITWFCSFSQKMKQNGFEVEAICTRHISAVRTDMWSKLDVTCRHRCACAATASYVTGNRQHHHSSSQKWFIYWEPRPRSTNKQQQQPHWNIAPRRTRRTPFAHHFPHPFCLGLSLSQPMFSHFKFFIPNGCRLRRHSTSDGTLFRWHRSRCGKRQMNNLPWDKAGNGGE